MFFARKTKWLSERALSARPQTFWRLHHVSAKRKTFFLFISPFLRLSFTSVFLSVSLFTRPFVFWRRLVLQGKKMVCAFFSQEQTKQEKNGKEKKRWGRSLKIIFCILQQKFDFVKKIILFVRSFQTQNLKCRLRFVKPTNAIYTKCFETFAFE